MAEEIRRRPSSIYTLTADIADASPPIGPPAYRQDGSSQESGTFDFSNFDFEPLPTELRHSVYYMGNAEHRAEAAEAPMPSQASLYQLPSRTETDPASPDFERPRPKSIPRVPVGSRSPSNPQLTSPEPTPNPDTNRPLLGGNEASMGLSFDRNGETQQSRGGGRLSQMASPEINISEWEEERPRGQSMSYSLNYGNDTDKAGGLTQPSEWQKG